MDIPSERLTQLTAQRQRLVMRMEQARMDDDTEATMVLVNVLNVIDADIDRELDAMNDRQHRRAR